MNTFCIASDFKNKFKILEVINYLNIIKIYFIGKCKKKLAFEIWEAIQGSLVSLWLNENIKPMNLNTSQKIKLKAVISV